MGNIKMKRSTVALKNPMAAVWGDSPLHEPELFHTWLDGCGTHWVHPMMNSTSPLAVAKKILPHQAIRNHFVRREKIRRYSINTESFAAVVRREYVS
jgi:hypothetical protein